MTTRRPGGIGAGGEGCGGGGQTEENSQSCEQMADPARCQQTNTGRGRFLFLVSPEGFQNWKEANLADDHAAAAPSGATELALTQTRDGVQWREGRGWVRGRRPGGYRQ